MHPASPERSLVLLICCCPSRALYFDKSEWKAVSHNYSELKKKGILDWERSDKMSEPSSSHKEKQLNAVSQEQIVKRTLNVRQMPVFLQCVSHGEAFFQVLR